MFGLSAGGNSARGSAVERLLGRERERQWRDLILIASESICHPESARFLSSEFTNIYAEGQPEPPLLPEPAAAALDPARFASWHRRLTDGRFYRGCEGADVAELLAKRFIAETLALLPGSPGAGAIRVNVQALSGAPANTAVYQALLSHGDAICGLDLACGGHLTHGSEFNYSGKSFRVASYGIDPETRRLDYDAIRELARAHGPRLIIGGASAYPWDFDWPRLRSIADEVGAYLLADVSHLAGLVAAGVVSNPVGHAHVVTFTTHKTLCGPRGAVIVTTDPDLAARINAGVFPGLQGGPHLHTITALARHFELLLEHRDEFVAMQRAITDNAAFLAECLRDEGFALEYGGTNTHMVLVDLKAFAPKCAPTSAAGAIDGETASRMLERAGLVCNKNMLPGDPDGAAASGIRMGTPWITQRGIDREGIRAIASIARSVLDEVRTFRA